MPPPYTPEEGVAHHLALDTHQPVPARSESPLPDNRPSNDESPTAPMPARNEIQGSQAPSPTLPRDNFTYTPKLDWPALEYVEDVSQNLMCPICQSPLVSPVVTRCEHTFCSTCFDEMLDHDNTCCPLDRKSFARDIARGRFPAKPAPRIIQNMLDELIVRCPNRRCNRVETRSAIKRHFEDECGYTKIACVSTRCDGLVCRMDQTESCQHMMVQCPHCFSLVDAADSDDHYERECTATPKDCEHCGAAVLQHRYSVHVQQDCPEIPRRCEHASVGCTVVLKQAELKQHERGCAFGALARMTQIFRRDMGSMEDKLREFEQKAKEQELNARLQTGYVMELVAGVEHDILSLRSRMNDSRSSPQSGHTPDSPPTPRTTRRNTLSEHIAISDFMTSMSRDLTGQGGSRIPDLQQTRRDNNIQDDAQSFILAGLTSCEERVSVLEQRLQEQDARHNRILANEMLPVQDQLTELRTAITNIGMDLRVVIARQKSMFSGNGARLHNAVSAASNGASGGVSTEADGGSSGQGPGGSGRSDLFVSTFGSLTPLGITPPRL